MARNAIAGTVVKGPLEKAMVFADFDGDGVKGPSEPSAITDADGNYSFESVDAMATIVCTTTDETVDKSSGEPLSNVVLKAPAGASVITPATTILEATPDIRPEQLAVALGGTLRRPFLVLSRAGLVRPSEPPGQRVAIPPSSTGLEGRYVRVSFF